MQQNVRREEDGTTLIMPNDKYVQFRLNARHKEYLRKFDSEKQLHEQLDTYFPYEILRTLLVLKRVEKDVLSREKRMFLGTNFDEDVFAKAYEEIESLCQIPSTDCLVQETALSRLPAE